MVYDVVAHPEQAVTLPRYQFGVKSRKAPTQKKEEGNAAVAAASVMERR
jgi:hypothetical protein